jgi:hypothetical protein
MELLARRNAVQLLWIFFWYKLMFFEEKQEGRTPTVKIILEKKTQRVPVTTYKQRERI